MKYLVTGGAGFIGSNTVARLLSQGDEVRVLDNFSTGHRENLSGFGSDVELLEGDVRSYERAHNAVRGMDRVIHLAALPSVPRSVQDPLTTHEVNATGTLNVLLAARDAGVQRVVFASSSSIYGANSQLPKHESLVPMPISPYAVSKLAAEQYAHAFHAVYHLETVALRYFNIFGPNQDPNSQYSAVIPKFIVAGFEGRPVTVFGDGSQTRDFTFVDNCVEMTLRACVADGAPGSLLNVAAGSRHSLAEVIDLIGKYVGSPLTVEFKDPRVGDVKDSWADISHTCDVLGIQPSVDLASGLERTVEWMRRKLQES